MEVDFYFGGKLNQASAGEMDCRVGSRLLSISQKRSPASPLQDADWLANEMESGGIKSETDKSENLLVSGLMGSVGVEDVQTEGSEEDGLKNFSWRFHPAQIT